MADARAVVVSGPIRGFASLRAAVGAQPCRRVSAMIEVVGIGDDGWSGLSEATRNLVGRADTVIGSPRQLDLLPSMGQQERRPLPSPLRDNLQSLVGESSRNTVVLASGDPLLSGIGTTLIKAVGREAVRVHPALSSEALARARMGWSAESVDVVTLVGRSTDRFLPFVTPGSRLVLLCSDGDGPAEVARLAVEAGAGTAQLTAWWHLGGQNEGSNSTTCAAWGDERTPDLVVVCLEVGVLDAEPQALGPAPGRADDAFEHDGLITKRDVRATALARLRPLPGQVLWDLGAGSGAVGIEWCLAAPHARTVAIERDPDRAARVTQNAARFGVSSRVDVHVTSTGAAVRDDTLPRPDAVFLGGGLERDVVDTAVAALRPGGRLVAHAVTTESEALLHEAHRTQGGELTRLAVEHLEPLGRFHGWKPARSVVQWCLTRPTRLKEPA